MPIYEYNCQNCGDDFECIVFRTDEPVSCPKCGNEAPTKKMSSFGFSVGSKFKSAGSGSGCAGCSSSDCSSCS
ncbi:MAG: Zinc ribbon domain protein [Syntrophorhabdaceae bacterium PtaU1.Bin034]|nr:MAG: Zinc ribbon domain protein [Syntrophorhabdaceae bacterium PtaU1.Bin034]